MLLFFVHTSFVLMASMQRLHLSGAALLKAFYVRRAFRIYPLSICCVILVVWLRVPALPWLEFERPSATAIAANLALVTNLSYSTNVLGPLWSLPLELQMYLVLPLFFMYLGESKSLLRLIAICVIAVTTALVFPEISNRAAGAVFAPCFAAGAAAYVMHDRVRARVSGNLFLPFLVVIIVAYFLIENRFEGIHHPLLQWITCLVVGMSIPYFEQSQMARLNSFASEVARYSYGIYLFHCIVLWACLYQLHAATIVQWSVAALLLPLTVIASFHCVEQPAIFLGARLARRLVPESTRVPARTKPALARASQSHL